MPKREVGQPRASALLVGGHSRHTCRLHSRPIFLLYSEEQWRGNYWEQEKHAWFLREPWQAEDRAWGGGGRRKWSMCSEAGLSLESPSKKDTLEDGVIFPFLCLNLQIIFYMSTPFSARTHFVIHCVLRAICFSLLDYGAKFIFVFQSSCPFKKVSGSLKTVIQANSIFLRINCKWVLNKLGEIKFPSVLGCVCL